MFLEVNTATVALYVMIVLLATVLAFLSQGKWNPCCTTDGTTTLHRESNNMPFVLSFVVLAFFSCFSAVGADREGYSYIFANSGLLDGNPWNLEIGYRLLMSLVRTFTFEPRIFLGVVGFLTLLFVYKGIWDCRDHLSIGTAVFIFASQYYLQSFNLMRMYFAMSIMILGVRFLLQKRYFCYFIVLLIASSFHRSMLFAVLAYLLAMALRKIKLSNFKKTVGILAVLTAFVPFSARIIVFVASLPVFNGKYDIYLGDIDGINIGMKFFINIIPFVVMLAINYKFKPEDVDTLSIILAYFAVFLITNVVSYSITIVGRALYPLYMPILIMLPIALQLAEKREYLADDCVTVFGIKLTYRILYVVVILSFLISFILYLNGYLVTDGIDEYHLIW